MTAPDPSRRVGVVVVHYGTDDLTMRCLQALVGDNDSPVTEVVLVDNGPGTGIVDRVRAERPEVVTLSPGRNTGFAAGCNLGITALGPCEHVALVNSDALVEPGWLAPLLAVLDSDPSVGAVVPKMVFEGRFHELALTATDTWRPGRGDKRELAWQLRKVELDGRDVTARCQLVEGFWEPARGGRWAARHSVLRVPAVAAAATVRLDLATPPGRVVELTLPGGGPARVAAGRGSLELALTDEPLVVINNIGNQWRPDGYGIDRGYQEADRGQHDTPTDVPGWCGGAVLLSGSYLSDVGAFDERLFLYYEDLELSRRGAARGWRYRSEPSSVVQHRHAASAWANPARSERLKERNRLLVLARHEHAGRVLRELARFVLVTASYLQRDVLAPALRGRPPRGSMVWIRSAALAGALARLPGMRLSRRRDRGRAHRTGMPPLA